MPADQRPPKTASRPDLVFEVEPGVFIDTNPGATQDDNGCDVSLIDEMLDLTPYERILRLRGWAELAGAYSLDDERGP